MFVLTLPDEQSDRPATPECPIGAALFPTSTRNIFFCGGNKRRLLLLYLCGREKASSGMGNASSYDVILIGSGAGGGTLAYRLAPIGKKILIIERRDYVPRDKENWESSSGQS